MSLSVFTVVMGEYSPDGVVRELASLGYDAVEWRIHPDFHIHPEALEGVAGKIGRLTESSGLRVSSLGTYVRVDQPEYLERCCRAAVAMGCPRVRIALARDYDGTVPYSIALALAKEHLRSAEPILERHGVRGLLETHHGSLAESASGARRLLDGVSPERFGVIFDPANMIISGRESWAMAIDVLGEYLAHVHVKNISWVRDDVAGWHWQYDRLDTGMVDWAQVVAALQVAGYDGDLSIEDLYGTPLATTGLAGEAIGEHRRAGVSTRQKLEEDLAYIRRCLARG